MAGPALIPDMAPSRAEQIAPRRGSQEPGPSREKAFARVQQDVAKAARSEAGRSENRAGAERLEKDRGRGEAVPEQARAKDGPASNEPAKNSDKSIRQGAADAKQSTPADPADSTSAAVDADAILLVQELETGSGVPLAAELRNPDDDAFALLAPALPSGSRGNNLPLTLTPAAGSAPAAGLPPVTATVAEANGLQQMFLQMAKGGEAGGEAGAKTDAGIDLESFKASLNEALESRGSRPADAPPPLVSSQRGLELREGSALVRQYSTSVDTPVQQGDWGDKMAGKISWLANQRISFAEIHLNPADLGPIEVRVNVQNDQASVAVHAQNASVRDLLELNGNRLREMLQDNGLNLAKMEVSDQPPRQQQQAAGGEAGQGAGSGENAGAEAEAGSLVSLDGEAISTGEIHLQWQSQVDTYA